MIDTPRPLRSTLPDTERLEVRTMLTVSLLQNFPDINFNQTSCNCTPPDTMMAVGSSNVLGAVNSALVLKDKSGNTLSGPEEFSTFFSSIHRSGDGFSDPQVMYDDQAQRYYVGIIEYPSSGTTGYYDFAVSNSSSPTGLTVGAGAGNWTVFSQITSVNESNTQFPDFPKMGWNNDAVFVSFNQFRSGISFTHNLILAISKSSILAGGPLTTHQTAVNTGSSLNILIPARMHNQASGNLEYFAQITGAGSTSTTVNVVSETNYNIGTGSFSTAPVTVNSYTNSPGVPGLTSQIDDRMLSADWINNNLVAAMNAGVGGLNLARWYQFSTSGTPSLVQQGDINVGAGISTSYPSIAIDPGGDIGITYIQSSSTQPYSMYVTGRLSSDPANTLQTGVEVAVGASPVPGANRGGDYSATEYDPANTSQFWSANEYNFDGSGSNFHWGTQIANYSLGPSTPPPQADLAVTISGPSSGNEGDQFSYTITVTNTNGYYPNDAPNVSLTDSLDPNLAFVSATVSQGTYSQSGGVVTFSLGTVTYGSSITATVVAQAKEEGSLINNASVSYGNDPVPGNNSQSATTAVAEPPINVSPPIVVTGKNISNLAVATFTHASGVEPASAFNASIDWGDGSTSAGTITLSSGTYTVRGSHRYRGTGSHTVTTTVTEAGAAPNVATLNLGGQSSGESALAGPGLSSFLAGPIPSSSDASLATPALSASSDRAGTLVVGSPPVRWFAPSRVSRVDPGLGRESVTADLAIIDLYPDAGITPAPSLQKLGFVRVVREKLIFPQIG
jgi:uncharacterized repeat protein (TIGR01451 family)